MVSGARDPHDLACLVGFGASAVNPIWPSSTPATSLPRAPSTSTRWRRKTTSGRPWRVTCSRSCPRWGSALSPPTAALSLRGDRAHPSRCAERRSATPAPASGVEARGWPVRRCSVTRPTRPEVPDPGGFYKHRRGSDTYVTSPMAVLGVQKAVRSGDPEDWDRYIEMISGSRPGPGARSPYLRAAGPGASRGGGTGRGDHAPIHDCDVSWCLSA